jgi:EcsC protein family
MDQTLPIPLTDPDPEIAALARRYARANGPLMALMTRFGGVVEGQMAVLPDALRRPIERAVVVGLEQALRVARSGRRAPDFGPRAAPVLAAMTGFAGGMGGLATAIPEIPVTVTLILHTIARAAEAEGFDPDDPQISAECLRVFAAGSPLSRDDGVNTAFLGARLALSGSAVQNLIRTLAPRIAATLGQKLAAQAVPVIGALSGAALNAAFLSYYRELARIRFALLRLSGEHGAERVMVAFRKAAEPVPVTKA